MDKQLLEWGVSFLFSLGLIVSGSNKRIGGLIGVLSMLLFLIYTFLFQAYGLSVLAFMMLFGMFVFAMQEDLR